MIIEEKFHDPDEMCALSVMDEEIKTMEAKIKKGTDKDFY